MPATYALGNARRMAQTPEERRRRELLVLRGRKRRQERELATVLSRSALLRAAGHRVRT